MAPRISRAISCGVIGLSTTLGLLPCVVSAGTATEIPLSTPTGITLINVVKVFPNATPQFLWRRLGDAEGNPLYIYDKDTKANQSACTDDCAKEFPPFIAPDHAVAQGDWSLLTRSHNLKQWVYQGHPLYRYSGKDPAGEPHSSETFVQGAADPAWMNPGSDLYSPRSGWRRASFSPEKTLSVPAGIALRDLEVAAGFGFVDATTGMVMYTLPPSQKTSREWIPVSAPALGQKVGAFSSVIQEDGTKQWAYQGRKLYTYRGDYVAGEANGAFTNQGAQVAFALRNFTPSTITINQFSGRGPLMLTVDGLSVYTQSRYHLQYGGRETRYGYNIPYNEAKSVGTRGCANDDCTQVWRPVLAPANAVGSGFWEVATRADGSKQWTYKGSPLYTYIGDKNPGDVEGNNRHVIVYGDPAGKETMVAVSIGDVTGKGGASPFGSGFYWHLASLL